LPAQKVLAVEVLAVEVPGKELVRVPALRLRRHRKLRGWLILQML
jgi:hypothetical protein